METIMEKDELIVKHLEMIQEVITRMARNSFMLKGWSMTIITALLALAASSKQSQFVFIAYIPALVFWSLDGFFLSQERYFRRLYDKVRHQIVDPKTAEEIEIFSMNAPKYAKPGDGWLPVSFSRTLMLFHGMVAFSITMVMVFI